MYLKNLKTLHLKILHKIEIIIVQVAAVKNCTNQHLKLSN